MPEQAVWLDLQEFFKHEQQPYPASPSGTGRLHTCQKSQLLEILKALVNTSDREARGNAIIIDGSALINALPPHYSKTFDNYAKEDVIPKVESYGARYERVDIVFDVYKK